MHHKVNFLLTSFNQEINPGPNQVGFDYSFIMAATQDRVPTVYIEDGHVVGLDPNDPIAIDYQNNFDGSLRVKTILIFSK